MCVNTTRWYRHKNGAVSAQQIERVATRLARADAGQLRGVVIHQSVSLPRAEDEHHLLRWGRDAPEGSCLIERWDYAASSQGFVRATVTEVHPASTGDNTDAG